MHGILVQDLVAKYGTHSVLRHLSFSWDGQGFLAVLGHNGTGKTTLFRCLSGQQAFQGHVQVLEKALSGAGSDIPPAGLGVLPQKVRPLFSLPAWQWVATGLYDPADKNRLSPAEERQKALAQLEAWGLLPLAEQEYAQLSGGEQQLVRLAQLMMRPRSLYLLDEPLQNLDLYYQLRIVDWMKDQIDQGRGVVCICHELDLVAQMAPGCLLNLSEEQPRLKPIEAATLAEARAYLSAPPRPKVRT